MDGTSLRVIRLDRGAPRSATRWLTRQLNLDAATPNQGKRAMLEPNMRALLQRVYDVLLRPVEAG